MSIFMIDDDKDLVELLSDYLESDLNCEIKTFSDGLTAVSEVISELLMNNTCEVIITDYQMPGMNGGELIKSVRENNFHGPIIMITGMNDSTINEIEKSDDNVVVLHKPFNIVDLSNLVAEVTRGSELKARLIF